MEGYYGRLEKLTNTIAHDGKYTDLKVNMYALCGYYTDDVLKELQSYLDKAIKVIGDSDVFAADRVKLVDGALESTRQVRNPALGAYDVRTGKSNEQEFEKIRKEFMEYYKSHALNWSINTAHNWTYVENTIVLKP